jgi:2-polyprenyl-6-hydroxyphenyl methylase/3-demethylubiquinone-9 3-methyltransferase
MTEVPPAAGVTLDPAEVARFDKLAAEWWDPYGKLKPLHRLNPTRLTYVRDALCRHFGRDARDTSSLADLTLLDIGCGGGLLCEPLARLGGRVTGIDPAADVIAAAQRHAAASGLAIDYRAIRAETLADAGVRFDAVLALEVVEHVPDVPAFIAVCARLMRPGGLMVVATLNRTLKSYALAIIGAEYILRWLPVGTHRWERFVTPQELKAALEHSGLSMGDVRGVVYDPLADEWRLAGDTDVNYMATGATQSS